MGDVDPKHPFLEKIVDKIFGDRLGGINDKILSSFKSDWAKLAFIILDFAYGSISLYFLYQLITHVL